MSILLKRWSALIARQHREPTGLLGRLVGARMRRQHMPETDWSVELLGLRPSDRVLEIGFGAGRGLALALARASSGSVLGLDRSRAMVRMAARSNRANLRGGRLSLLRGDLASLPLSGPCFDAILTIHTFYFWPDPLATAHSLARLLAPGGRLVSTFATTETLPNGERRVWPVQGRAEALLAALAEHPAYTATLARGPDSRRFNNIALLIERRPRAI